MADFRGVESFVEALTGSPAIEQAAYDSSMRRLIQQRSSQALLEKRLDDAAKAKIVADAFRNLRANEEPGRNTDILLGNLGGSFSGLQRGLGAEQQNAARSAAMAALSAAIEGGENIPVDEVNAALAIAGDKLLTPTNVNVRRHSEAEIAKDVATADLTGYRKNEIDAKIGAWEALTGKRQADTGRGTVSAGKPHKFTDTTKAMLFPPDENGVFGDYQAFVQWQTEQALIDPAYNDDRFAYGMYQRGIDATDKKLGDAKSTGVSAFYEAQRALAGDPAAAPAAPAAPVEPAGQIDYPNMADADLIMQAALQALEDGADPEYVRRVLDEELAKLGLSVE